MTKRKEPAIIVDAEFADLLGELSPEEIQQLELNLLEENGARDPLVIWTETGIIVDGMNRKAICEKLGLGFKVIKRSFPDRLSAMRWMFDNQRGRRHLTDSRRRNLLGLLYNESKGVQGGDRRSDAAQENGNAGEVIAVAESVSPGTVINAAKFNTAISSLSKTIRQDILDENPKASLRDVQRLAELPAGDQRKVVKAVQAGVASRIGEAIEALAEDGEPPAVVEPEPVDLMTEWNSALEKWARKVNALLDELPDGKWIDTTRKDIIVSQMKTPAATARSFKGVGVCPLCSGDGCKRCRQTGFMPRAEFDATNE